MTVHVMVRKNKNVAGVVINSEPFLLGLPEVVHSRLRDDAIEARAPAAWKKLTRGASLTKQPEKFAQAAANMRRFFFDPIQRPKMSRRVGGFD